MLYCATAGEAWRAGADRDEQRRLRRRELVAACETLGIAEVRLRAYPDGGLGQLAADVLVADIAATIRDCAPRVVVTFGPEGRTLHPDHIAIHRAATRAFALARRDVAAPARLCYTTVAASVARPTGWRFPTTPDEAIDVTIDVTPWLDLEAPGHRHRPRQPVPRPPVLQRRRGDLLAGAGPRGFRAGRRLPAPAASGEERPVCGAW